MVLYFAGLLAKKKGMKHLLNPCRERTCLRNEADLNNGFVAEMERRHSGEPQILG
jgi:hypothetical protein